MKRLLRLLPLLVLLALHTGLAQDDTTAGISPALREQMDQIEAQTSDLRALALQTEIPRRFPTRDQLVDYLVDLFNEELPPEVAERETLFYVAFDFLPPGTDLRGIYLDLYSQQVAGFYDSEAKTMNVILISGEQPEDELPLIEELTYSHEFVHTLQDQHFDLEGMLTSLESDPDNTDGSLALLSLIEGDATLAMSQYTYQRVQDNPGAALVQILSEGAEAGALEIPEGTPPIITAELLFPYQAGMDFVSTLYNRGGWSRVNDAFTNPPQSSEHIYHPQTYLDGEAPLDVTLAPAGDLPGENWNLVFERTLGEFYLRQYLGTQISDRREVARAGTGWGGDRYRLYRHAETGDLAWVMRLAWDTPEDAAEFDATYTAFAESRLGNPMDTPCWFDEDETICFLTGDDSTTIAYAPSHELALDLLEQGTE